MENSTDENTCGKDWKVDAEPSDKRQTPTFVRLFVTHRILKYHIQKHKPNASDDNVIQSLVSVVNNTKDQEAASSLLSKLAKYGIKTYMNKHCNYTDTTTYITDQIFDKIILTKFSQEYARVTTYVRMNDNKKQHYQCIVFNTKDIMNLIFQFREFNNNDINNFSLVCSHWLYHSFDPNSFYHIELNELISNKSLMIDNPKNTRLWQRLVNAKSITLSRNNNRNTRVGIRQPNNFLLSKILMAVKNIEKIFIWSIKPKPWEEINIFLAIMWQCCQNIKYFNVKPAHFSKGVSKEALSPLKLLNAEIIHMHRLHFWIMWSNKCKELYIYKTSMEEGDDEWFNFVINKCDCSGIKYLSFKNATICCDLISWGHKNDDNEIDVEKLFTKFLEQFINLKKIHFSFMQNFEDFIDFWKYINPVICKNNIFVEINIESFFEREYDMLIEAIEKDEVKIDSIEVETAKYKDHSDITKNVIVKLNQLECLIIRYAWLNDGVVPLQEFVETIGKCLSLILSTGVDTSMGNENGVNDHDKNSIAKGAVTEEDDNKNENKNKNKNKNKTEKHQETEIINTSETEVELIQQNMSNINSNDKKDDTIGKNKRGDIFMAPLKLISVYHVLFESQLSIVNEVILYLIDIVNNILKRHIHIRATFFISELTGDKIDDYRSLFDAFNKFCQIMLDLFDNQLVLPITIKLRIPIVNGKEFVANEMKRIFSTFEDEKFSKLTNYKQPKGNKYCTPSSKPIFRTIQKENVVFECGNCE